jgi:transposase-like protein
MVGAQRDPRKEAHWRRQLQKQSASALSVREFCQQHGLAESAFYYWRREIERRDDERIGVGKPAFLPVEVKTPANESAIEVALVSGHVLRLRSGFDADTLRELLTLLEEPSC